MPGVKLIFHLCESVQKGHRQRERVHVWERVSACVCVCVWASECVRVGVCGCERASECVWVCVCVRERVRVGVCVCERVSEWAREREKERDVSTLKLEFALTTCYSDDVGRANPFSTHDHPQMNKEPRCRDKPMKKWERDGHTRVSRKSKNGWKDQWEPSLRLK